MGISVGDHIPLADLTVMGTEGPERITSDKVFADRKVVLIAVPGAFTPNCSESHLPGFVEKADAIKARGVDAIACLSVNDPFVMAAWGEAENVDNRIMLLSDGNGEFTKAMGLEADLREKGLGMRSKRYAAIVDNGVIQDLAIDETGEVQKSAADRVLEKLSAS